MDKEKIIERLLKIKALSERGDRGEKTSAQDFLNKLMDKYGVSEQDFVSDKVDFYSFTFENWLERRLLIQIFAMVLPSDSVHYFNKDKRRKPLLSVYCTQVQQIEIDFLFSFYRKALKEELEDFYLAFLHKNKLFPDSAVDNVNVDDALDMERAMKIVQLMEGMQRHTPKKQITVKGEENE